MKSLFYALILIFAAFVVFNNFVPTTGGFEERRVLRAVAPFRYAALYAREPDAKISIPIRQIKKSSIADTFGAPRGSDRTHQGQDIFAKRNTPVYAATDGFVFRVGENNLGGNTVWTIGAGGRVYYYAHLERYADDLQVGDPVTKNTIVGYVGTSGNAKGTPPHLHFGVYAAGGAINPRDLFE
jgi:murein DD-endopeptidase MepM/ murein hydrolase activator NlpD